MGKGFGMGMAQVKAGIVANSARERNCCEKFSRESAASLHRNFKSFSSRIVIRGRRPFSRTSWI
jgi:hypothetical protein